VDSFNYASAVAAATNIKRQLGNDIRPEIVLAALQSAINGENLQMTPEAAGMYANNYAINKTILEGRRYQEMNRKRPEVTTTASGLQYEVLQKGAGTVSPVATSRVEVHYHGTLIDGTVFDSSLERKMPATFELNRVISGWTEGVQLMKEGDKFRFVIPSELAYKNRGSGAKIRPGATLIFEVELLRIVQQ
jgi:FKBP-type peptidyl-prolyl cis-trans isomerase